MDAYSNPDLPPLIVFDRVDKRYGSRSVLAQLSFSIARNQFVLLSGPSGAGKSTVLRLIAALEQPSSGSITVAGEPLGRLKPKMLPLLRRSMGIVLQDLMLLDDRNILQNVALPCAAAGIAWREALARAAAALQRVGLDETAGRSYPRELSGGEQQRAALARALVNHPALLLVDEPTAHLDPLAAAHVVQLLEQFVIAGVTVVMASHGESVAMPSRARVIALESAQVAA
ncbi:MAG TPA: ATP-binding cassette domain-containing protein [Burkholderiaceae bacterium]|nr:ATP-binding cassette domain-containing protein [Burkholderiaceae bacterium]